MPSFITVSDLAELTFSISSDGAITISYPGQTSISIAVSSYRMLYSFGVLGSGTNPLTLAVKSVGAPAGSLKTKSYVNNSALAVSFGTSGGGSYIIQGSGDLRPTSMSTPFSISIDNQSCNSGSASYANYATIRTTGSGAGATLTFYYP